ncbi:MAG: LLM class flavin-dependent oxidoreductase [Acidimicrobiaceae bacterium]|nr:LLM class flavin-dependent oxidoreductase [Acidimicrobiaceae bacterium]MXW74908.1 LLM class flavin-dependent oxidoreductase [Acidimicrobiaceae bacterium]MYA74742.1 LLM class flavin-dependent oxidoreductase [Acidimicrobiaceae bacterium]MYC41971.1 LLM class flavin-dependent oxidoreductase [Acidimicrobiaceae bacterium]MYD06723.1 LLM class flavin-dependent oxidoreductase [Acidimicrobiaceae bacterium]
MDIVLEAEISPQMSTASTVRLAQMVEDTGFARLGISDVVYWPDSFMVQALCAQATNRIAVGAMVTNPYTRHPVVLAGALATLDDLAGGRAFCGLGVGAGLEPLGIDYPKPVAALRRTVTEIRTLLNGEEAGGERLIRPPTHPIPISIGTRSPQVMRLAGEVADIALVGGRYLSAELAAQYRSWLADGAGRVGRALEDLEVAPRLTLCCSPDGDLARRSVKRYVAHYLTLIRPAELAVEPERMTAIESALARSQGWYFDHNRTDDEALDHLIDNRLVEAFTIVGTPDECAQQLESVLDMGFTSVSLNLAATARSTATEGLAETITSFSPVVASLTASS